MNLSAEARWFWPESDSALTERVESWLAGLADHAPGGLPPGEGDARDDVYLVEPGLDKLGIKTRGGKPGLEVKAFLGHRRLPALDTPVELWCKWSVAGLSMVPDRRVKTSKRRRLRKIGLDGPHPQHIPLDSDEKPKDRSAPLPQAGCNIELTWVGIEGGRTWWTLGLEAFADTQDGSVAALQRVLEMLSLPDLGEAKAMSYPEWLSGAGARRRG